MLEAAEAEAEELAELQASEECSRSRLSPGPPPLGQEKLQTFPGSAFLICRTQSVKLLSCFPNAQATRAKANEMRVNPDDLKSESTSSVLFTSI